MQELKDHFLTHQEENKEDEEEYPSQWDPIMEKALGIVLRFITFKPEGAQENDFLQFFSDKNGDVAEYLENETKGTNAMKWHINCGIQFVKYNKDGNKQDTVKLSTSRCVIKLPGEDRDMLNASIGQSYLKMFAACKEFQKEGSGWAVDELLHLNFSWGNTNH